MLLELPDPSFSDAVLKMCVDATERERLSRVGHCFSKFVVGKYPVVGVVMENFDSAVRRLLFECHFGFDGLFCSS